ncbi:Ger(x)C family spore germination protein [Paenibacillus methanolicus]|uniref:Spore germination protein KC n=1 Tax=Paenibacillus methanolicus TaxID=582686 RepID=A0A5S5CHP2_9BACL|nr:Ger(x)C family spore germination protein [Paenibacillus methanolicus]TYP78128.1 spore germination protein KC [Paenibacillus methanolicus]
MKGVRWLWTGLTLAAACALLSGCWDLTEVNRSALLTGVAVEPGKNGRHRVTFEVLNAAGAMPSQGQGSGVPTVLYTVEGNSIADTASRLNENVERLMMPSHVRVIVIDERTARKGLNAFIDLVQRSRYVREDVLLLIAKDVPASDMLQVLSPGGIYASWKIQSQVENFRKEWGGVPLSRLFDYTQAILVEGRDLTLGAITVIGNVKANDKGRSFQSAIPQSNVKIAGAAVFRDDRLIGYLSIYETRILNLIRGELEQTGVAFPLPNHEGHASVRVNRAHTHVRVAMKNGLPYIRLRIEGEGQLNSLDADLPVHKVEGFQALEQALSEYMREQTLQMIGRVQRQYGVDVFGFGEHLYRHRYREFQPIRKEWNALFAKAKVEASVKFVITGSELKNRSIRKQQ